MNEIQNAIIQARAVAIIRGDYRQTIDAVVESLLAGGVKGIEITMNSADALRLIEQVAKRYGSSALVGAGTVLEAAQVTQIANAGGQFIVAPDTFPEVIQAALQHGLEPLPGVLTPTEARTALRAGASLLKLFPATLGGADYLKQIRAPLNDAHFIPTGGITADNVAEYIKAGAVAVGLGSWLVPSVFDGSQAACQSLTERASRLMQAIAAAS